VTLSKYPQLPLSVTFRFRIFGWLAAESASAATAIQGLLCYNKFQQLVSTDIVAHIKISQVLLWIKLLTVLNHMSEVKLSHTEGSIQGSIKINSRCHGYYLPHYQQTCNKPIMSLEL